MPFRFHPFQDMTIFLDRMFRVKRLRLTHKGLTYSGDVAVLSDLHRSIHDIHEDLRGALTHSKQWRELAP